jgi:hypothetical protein
MFLWNVTLHHSTDTSCRNRDCNCTTAEGNTLQFLVNDQRDAQFFSMCLFLILTHYMIRAHCAHHQERQIVSIQLLVAVGGCIMCRLEVHFWPAHDTATDTEWQLLEVVLTHFVSPDDAHDVLETCRELKIKINTEKNCVSHWSFTKNHYMMHGQQNIKPCSSFWL